MYCSSVNFFIIYFCLRTIHSIFHRNNHFIRYFIHSLSCKLQRKKRIQNCVACSSSYFANIWNWPLFYLQNKSWWTQIKPINKRRRTKICKISETTSRLRRSQKTLPKNERHCFLS